MSKPGCLKSAPKTATGRLWQVGSGCGVTSSASGSCLRPLTASSCSTKLRMPSLGPISSRSCPCTMTPPSKGGPTASSKPTRSRRSGFVTTWTGLTRLMSGGLTWSSKFRCRLSEPERKCWRPGLGGLKVGAGCLRELAANVHLAPAHIDKAAKVADYCQPRTPADTGKILKTVIGNVHKALNLQAGERVWSTARPFLQPRPCQCRP